MESTVKILKKSMEIYNGIKINNMKKTDYRNKISYEKRCSESQRLRIKYINSVPIIIESSDLVIKKNKFLTEMTNTTSSFIYSIRKQLQLSPEKAIFIFCDDKLLNLTQTIGEIYQNYLHNNKIKSDGDLFLYFEIKEESTFG